MSLRGRLVLAAGAVALVALLGAGVATYSALRSFLHQRVDRSLDSAHAAVERALVNRAAFGGPVVPILGPTFVQLRDARGAIVASRPASRSDGRAVTPRLPEQVLRLPVPPGPLAVRQYATVPSVERGGPDLRVRATVLPGGTRLILGLPLDDTADTLRRLVVIEVAVALMALMVSGGLGWWLVRVGLRPLADVEATAAAIAQGQLDRRVSGATASTEVGRLARALNVMLARIQEAFAARDATEAQLRRFVADASHELRTPLAAIGAYAELFDRGAQTRPEDLARVMTGIRGETGRMRELVEDLLLLARLDEGRPLAREPVELVALCAAAVEAAVTVGPEWPVRLEATRPVEVVGDEARLREVLDNLLSNVRAHTPPGPTTVVRVSTDGIDAVIEVADQGAGISDVQAQRVFERFYRTEESRSRQHGGAGLGLSIVAAVVAAHGGTVAASRGAGQGATFTVRLPIADADADPGLASTRG